MPTFIRPKYAIVEPGGGGGGLVAAVAVIGAWGYLAWWLAREIFRAAAELAVIAGGGAAFVVAMCAYFAVRFARADRRRTGLQVDQSAKAAAIANARARLAAPAGEVHHHTHYEDHTHHHYDERQLHIHQAPAAEPGPAIAARKVVPGVVVGATPEAIEARKAPLYRINASERAAIEKRTT
jgi:hypothetical protein